MVLTRRSSYPEPPTEAAQPPHKHAKTTDVRPLSTPSCVPSRVVATQELATTNLTQTTVTCRRWRSQRRSCPHTASSPPTPSSPRTTPSPSASLLPSPRPPRAVSQVPPVPHWSHRVCLTVVIGVLPGAAKCTRARATASRNCMPLASFEARVPSCPCQRTPRACAPKEGARIYRGYLLSDCFAGSPARQSQRRRTHASCMLVEAAPEFEWQ